MDQLDRIIILLLLLIASRNMSEYQLLGSEEQNIERVDGSTNHDFMLTTLAPDHFGVMPPSGDNNDMFTKKQTLNGTISGVAALSGALLYMPMASADALVVLVPAIAEDQGATPQNGGFHPATLQIVNPQRNTVVLFTVTAGYYLPTRAQPIHITPDLAKTFTTSRMYASYVQLKSDTTTTAKTSLSGELHATSVNDIRGLRTMETANLIQSCTNGKDVVLSSGVTSGITVIQGPDICKEATPPSPVYAGSDATSLLMANVVGVAYDYGAAVQAADLPCYAFVAPGINVAVPTFGQGFSKLYVSQLADYPPLTCVDFDITLTATAGGLPPSLIEVVDVWAVYDADGPTDLFNSKFTTFTARTVYSTVCQTTSIIGASVLPGAALENFAPGYNITLAAQSQVIRHRSLHLEPQLENVALSGSQAPFGTLPAKYYWIGCTIVYPQVVDQGPASIVFPPVLTATMSFTPMIRGILREGIAGPARIIKWNDVGAGQDVHVRGCQWQQLVATQQFAPFLTSRDENGAIEAKLLPMLARLYNGRSQDFKRVWTTLDYQDYVKRLKDPNRKELVRAVARGLHERVHDDAYYVGVLF